MFNSDFHSFDRKQIASILNFVILGFGEFLIFWAESAFY